SYIRCAFQYCNDPLPSMIEYLNLNSESMAISVDPLLVAWLSYQPRLKGSAGASGVKHAWILSAPEIPSISSYIRCAFQYCNDPLPSMIEYLNLNSESMAISVDPLLVAWLSYQPRLKGSADPQAQSSSHTKPMPSYLLKRKGTPPILHPMRIPILQRPTSIYDRVPEPEF
ncbi:jg26437, partial [Pararge aegeria aegeria]